MANIAILGSSFSETLYRHKHENEIQKKPWNKRPRLPHAPGIGYTDKKNHWVGLLAKKYPHHKFHIFAKGGTGWEYAQQILHMLSEKKTCDRIIVELCDYRALILSQDIAFNKLKKTRGDLKFYIPPYRDSYQAMIDHIKENIAINSQHEIDNNKIILHNVRTPYIFSTDVLEYMVRSVMSPVYTTRYRNYLSSLINVWPHVFDKIGVWAYEPFDIPHPVNFNANKKYFDNQIQYFEETMIEKWFKDDPINNSIDSWKNKYYGHDGYHLNKEGMPLLVDFLLKQSSIQRVLK